MTRRPNNEHGATYLVVMFLVVVMGITSMAAGKQWKTVMQREREADLLARGIEIQTAIALYSAGKKQGRVVPGEIYPLTLEEMTKQPKPVLRKVYKDPLTGDDWDYIRDPASGRIKGVRSKSKDAPIKQHNFPTVIAHFEGLTHYNEWLFQYPTISMIQNPQLPAGQTAPGTVPPQQPGTLVMPGSPGTFGAPQPPFGSAPVPVPSSPTP